MFRATYQEPTDGNQSTRLQVLRKTHLAYSLSEFVKTWISVRLRDSNICVSSPNPKLGSLQPTLRSSKVNPIAQVNREA